MVRMLLLPTIQKMLSDRVFTLESSLTGWTNIHISSYMAAVEGFEPSNTWVKAMRVNHFATPLNNQDAKEF